MSGDGKAQRGASEASDGLPFAETGCGHLTRFVTAVQVEPMACFPEGAVVWGMSAAQRKLHAT